MKRERRGGERNEKKRRREGGAGESEWQALRDKKRTSGNHLVTIKFVG